MGDNELTYHDSGIAENYQSLWPAQSEMVQLSIECVHSYEAFFYFRRYCTLEQMRTLSLVASASGSTFYSYAITFVKMTHIQSCCYGSL